MTPPSILLPRLERPGFFDGQQLAPNDLEAIHEYHRELRWLHNRTLHNWGIAVGLNVSGDKGERVVRITPGYGVDCLGRDLLLSVEETLPVPAVSGSGAPVMYYLTICYLEDAELPVSENRQGVCTGPGAVRRTERPRLRWQRPIDFNPATRYRRGFDLILATIQVEGCVLAAPASATDRRYALNETRPYIAAGATNDGGTDWLLTQGNAGVETMVDTSAAGFGRTPVYLANLVGIRSQLSLSRIFDGFGSVAAASATGFTFRVMMPRDLLLPPFIMNPSPAFNSALPAILRDTLRWSVSWTGIEE